MNTKLATAILLATLLGSSAMGQVPVTDSATLSQSIKQVLELQKQYEALQNQISELNNIKEKLSGMADLSGLKDSFKGITPEMGNLLGLSDGNLPESGELKKRIDGLLKANFTEAKKVFKDVEGLNSKIYQAKARRSASNQVIAGEFEGQVNQSLSNIKSIQKKLKTAETAKEVADLQAQILSEQTIIQGLQLKADALKINNEAMKAQEELQQKVDTEKVQKEARDRVFGKEKP